MCKGIKFIKVLPKKTTNGSIKILQSGENNYHFNKCCSIEKCLILGFSPFFGEVKAWKKNWYGCMGQAR